MSAAESYNINEGMNEEEMDRFLDKIKTEYKDGWTEENWEEELEKHPFFMTKPIDESCEELPPAIEAIRQIKWDENDTPKEKAVQFKEEGNVYFRSKKYKLALRAYQAAIKEKFEDEELYSVLHANCAAAEFNLENYRSAFKYCVVSRKHNDKNLKAIYRGAECCLKLKLFDVGIKWCDTGSIIDPSLKTFTELRSKIEAAKKAYERDKRKREAQDRKRSDGERKILDLIKKKGIRVQDDDESFNLFDKSCNPQGRIVTVADDGVSLVWPVMFLYPEYGQTDFIEAFDENSTFDDHMKVMFAESAPWDTDKKYNLKSMRVYYENRRRGCLTKIKGTSSLLQVLQSEGFIIQVGTPSFIVMVANSEFEKIYLEKFSSI